MSHWKIALTALCFSDFPFLLLFVVYRVMLKVSHHVLAQNPDGRAAHHAVTLLHAATCYHGAHTEDTTLRGCHAVHHLAASAEHSVGTMYLSSCRCRRIFFLFILIGILISFNMVFTVIKMMRGSNPVRRRRKKPGSGLWHSDAVRLVRLCPQASPH